jgi:hypothetical protein
MSRCGYGHKRPTRAPVGPRDVSPCAFSTQEVALRRAREWPWRRLLILGSFFIKPADRKILEDTMQTSETLRQHASNCEQLEEAAPTEAARKRFQRMRHAWLALAASQDWLDGLVSPHLERPEATARFSRLGNQ